MLFGLADMQAQESIYVEETNGTLTQVPLTQVQKITFSGTDMVLHKTDATTITWAIINIQKYFYDLTTNINNTISDDNDILIYPNPSNGDFKINYQIKQKGFVKISILSIEGKTIETLLSENKEQGSYSLNSTKNLDPGTYFVTIENNNNLVTKKIIILK
jgi:hypothetical protein